MLTEQAQKWTNREEWIAFLRTKQFHLCAACGQTCRDAEFCTCPDGEAKKERWWSRDNPLLYPDAPR